MRRSTDSTFPASGGPQGIRRLIFYGISLLLSLLIIVISITFFVVVVYLEGRVTEDFFYLFTGIIIVNLAISALSVKGLMTLYPILRPKNGEFRTIILSRSDEMRRSGDTTSMTRVNSEYFTDLELEVIELIKNNGNRMLQSRIVTTIDASKASISRTLTSLENKGVVVRMRKGVTNEIILNETYSN
jgi:uncharacterized membrane protein